MGDEKDVGWKLGEELLSGKPLIVENITTDTDGQIAKGIAEVMRTKNKLIHFQNFLDLLRRKILAISLCEGT